MYGLGQFNKLKREKYKGVESASAWTKKMDELYQYGSPLWGTSVSIVSGSSNVAPVPDPVVNPLAETVARLSQIPDTYGPTALAEIYAPAETRVIGGSNEYNKKFMTFAKSTAPLVKINSPFMTPLFRMDLTNGYSATQNVWGFVFDNNLMSQSTVVGWDTSNGHMSNYPANVNSIATSFSAKPDSETIYALLIVFSTTAAPEFALWGFDPDNYTGSRLQFRSLSSEIKHNSWVGIARDNYNFWLYSYPPNQSTFNISAARWDRLIEVSSFIVDDNYDKFELFAHYQMQSYPNGQAIFTQQMAIPNLEL